jgi:uncharacterized membrane protein
MPIVNSAPIFSSLLAVFFLGEVWVLQNIIGTSLVIIGVIILSSGKPVGGQWRKLDVIYPILGALAFGISTTLRKTGLMELQIPILGAVTVGTAFSFCWLLFKYGRAPGAQVQSAKQWLVTRRRFGKHRRDSISFFRPQCQQRCSSGTVNRLQSVAEPSMDRHFSQRTRTICPYRVEHW